MSYLNAATAASATSSSTAEKNLLIEKLSSSLNANLVQDRIQIANGSSP